MAVRLLITIFVLISIVSTTRADVDVMRRFSFDYSILNQDLLNHVGEQAKIKDFVYQKDLITFHFEEGLIHLLRYVDDRPTTAIFIGKGRATMSIPSHVERRSLFCVARDSILNESFKVCFIRMADDFDLRLREKFAFHDKELSWKNFTISKQAQGEMFFKPIIHHTYDNYFQLLRSHYERSEDGYFWADFNRYVFSFDPNRPEETLLAYEFEGGDFAVTEAASYQRQERGIYSDSLMSIIDYPTEIVDRQTTLNMGGLDGQTIEKAQSTIKIVINRDSLRFVSLFLHYNLKEDSIYYDGNRVDYYRRKDFNFIGVILPAYRHQGDTITLTFWYKGKNFEQAVPYVENPSASPHHYTFIAPKDYNYVVPGRTGDRELVNGIQRITASHSNSFNKYFFQGYATGYDTVTEKSDLGLSLHFLKSSHITKRYYNCYVPENKYRPAVVDAFNFMTSRLGGPPGAFEMFVYPMGKRTGPGLMQVSQIDCITGGYMDAVGGIHTTAGVAAGQQWFGSLLQPRSDREKWLVYAVPQYLSMLFVQDALGSGKFYSNLVSRRDSIYTIVERRRDMPLATGSRANKTILSNKGLWLLHMLRMLLLDLETQSDSKFMRLIYEASLQFNSQQFTNHDFVRLAEKQYGKSLDWFFRQWLYGHNFPKYKIEYRIVGKGSEYEIEVRAETKGVDENFIMPVLMRVEYKDGNSKFMRHKVNAGKSTFTLGPFEREPVELSFNEFFSVLSKDKVRRK